MRHLGVEFALDPTASLKTLWDKRVQYFQVSSSSLQVQQPYPSLELSLIQRLGQSISSLLFGSYMDKLYLPVFNLLTLEVHRQLYVLGLRVEFGIAGKRLSALVIGRDLERQIWEAVYLSEELYEVTGLFDNVRLANILGVCRGSCHSGLAS